MKTDSYGVAHVTTDELCEMLYQTPSLQLTNFTVDDPEWFNQSVKSLFYEIVPLRKYRLNSMPIPEFDAANQAEWFMPDTYKQMDIAMWILSLCKSDEELQRVGKELLLYQERELFDLLRFMKYFVDTMRKNNVVWGVGRGSSVASYVLYLIGVHKIDSIYYDLDIDEFLK